MAKEVKLADIAEKLGVSVVTVSKALSGQKGVSESLRSRIIDIADEIGYVQPSVARRRAMNTNYNIGVLIQESYLDRYSSFYWQMYQQVAQLSLDRGCFCLLEVITNQMEEQKILPKILVEDKVDGIIVIGTLEEKYLNNLMGATDKACIFMDFMDKNKTADSVISDSFYGAYYITNYLFDMGHKDIAYVGTLGATGSIMDRFLGYQKSLLEHGIAVNPDWIIDDRDKANGNIDENKKLILPEKMPTAFFCNCDLAAGILIRKLQKNGYKVPEDISVVGFDNYIYPGTCDVEITSYEVNFAEMAKRAVDNIIRKLGNEYYYKGISMVEGKLVVKDSVKKLTR